MRIPWPESRSQRMRFAVILTAIAAVVLVYLLKLPGLIISLLLFGAAWIMVTARPDATEQKALRSSIELSRDDILDVMTEYDNFLLSTDVDCVADRTLHRPALADEDCTESAIDAFHYRYNSCSRFLTRLRAHLANPELETHELETLLNVTDERAAELKNSWILARRAAAQLGQNYSRTRPITSRDADAGSDYDASAGRDAGASEDASAGRDASASEDAGRDEGEAPER